MIAKLKNAKKRKPLTKGQRFYFIGAIEEYPSLQKDIKNGEAIDMNSFSYLYIGESESYDPEFDMQSNCFRTKKEAKRSLKEIKEILKYRG